MEKEELIDLSMERRLELDILIKTIQENNDLETLVSPKWRVKDVMAHIYWHEQEMAQLLDSMNLQGSDYWLLPTNERNEKIFKDYFDIPTEQITKEYFETFNPVIEKLKNIPAEAMHNAKLFENMPIDWQPWKVFAGNLNKHYDDHISQLKKRFEYLK